MLNKLFLTLIGLFIAIYTICGIKEKSIENFGYGTMPSGDLKVMREVVYPSKCGSGSARSLNSNFSRPSGQFDNVSDKFVSYPSFQGYLSPRFSNLNYGANIKYNMPDYKNQAVPNTPLTFANMAREGYSASSCGGGSCSGGCSPKCGKCGLAPTIAVKGEGGYPLPPDVSAGNYGQVLGDVYKNSEYPEVVNSLPVGTMETIDAEGNVVQPVIYDRYMFANRNSRTRSLGDMIRGDLPITPCYGSWFSVHPNVNVDLQQGAMNVMGGFDNETAQKMSALVNAASGGTKDTIAGMNLTKSVVNNASKMNALSMMNQYNTTTNNGRDGWGDVNVTAFP